METHGKWFSIAAKIYYLTGLAYYFYHWIIIFGVASLLAAIPLYIFKAQTLVCFTVLLSILCFAALFVLVRKETQRHFIGGNPTLRIKQETVEYTFIDEHNAEFNRIIEATAVYPTSHYSCKHNWTGDGEISISSSDNCKIEISPDTDKPTDTCNVRFIKTIPKGGNITFNYRLIKHNSTKPIKPFFSKYIGYPITDALNISIRFGSGISLSSCSKNIFITSNSDVPIWQCDIDTHNQIETEVKWSCIKPVFGCLYLVAWTIKH